MRACLDSNVLFLAATSPTRRATALFRLAEMGRFKLCASSHSIEEARRNVAARPGDHLDDLDRLVRQIDRVAEAPAKLVSWAGEHRLGPGDAPVLAAAVAGGVDGFVTGDRSSFGHLFGERPGGVKVVSLGEALQFFLERETS
jgi:predicted nucleic acid-binding protein